MPVLSSAASLILALVGVLVLVGWAGDVQLLKGLAGEITMKANAAIGLLSAGAALGLAGTRSRRVALLGRCCAVLAGAVGALTLSQHLFGWNLGIDDLLFAEPPGAAATTSPGRMGPNASTSLTLAGIGLWLLYRGTPTAIAATQALAFCQAVLALVPTVGYLYGATELYAVARYTGIAAHTGLSLLVLSIGTLAARADIGPVAALTGDRPHAQMARRLLLAAVLVPLALGFVRVEGERRGFFDVGLGSSFFVVTVIVLLSMTIWHTAAALARSDAARRAAERERDDLLRLERSARERAEKADRAKDEFIAALSHELRTPLNAVLGWMQMLRQGTISPGSRDKAVEAVARNANVLARLIDDLLDTSRIATGHLDLNRAVVDIGLLVQSAIESVLPMAEARGVTVSASAASALPVYGDAHRLHQVVSNLLSNAVKFTPSGRRVTVCVSTSADRVLVRIEDEGEGIDAALLPHVFERFRQGSSVRVRAEGGLGLGLYIAKHLTELHGGSIHAESAGAGAGAAFTIELPTAGAAAGVGS